MSRETRARRRMKRMINSGRFDTLYTGEYLYRPRVRILLTGLTVLMLLAGACFAVVGAVELDKLEPDGHWPRVTGVSLDTWDAGRPPRPGLRTGYQDYFLVTTIYEYIVNGQPYTIYGIASPDRYQTEAEALASAPRYAGVRTTVWYDPTSPRRAELHPVDHTVGLVLTGTGVGFGLVALTLLVFPRRAARQ